MFLVSGFTFAAAFVPLTAQAMHGVRDGEKGLASDLFQTSTHPGGALVLTVLATAAAFRSSAALHTGVPNSSALTSGFSLAFLIGAHSLRSAPQQLCEPSHLIQFTFGDTSCS